MAGMIGPTYGWRTPYVFAALMGLCGTIVLLTVVKDRCPPTLLSKKSDHSRTRMSSLERSYRAKILKDLWRCRTNVLLVGQGFPGSMPWGMILIYLNDYLTRDKGLTIAEATSIIATFGIGAAVGSIGGGFLGQIVYRWKKSYLPVLMGTCTVLGTVPMYFLINAEGPQHHHRLLWHSLIAGALVNVTGSNVRAVLLNVNLPDTRGTVLTFSNILNTLGRGAGPVLASYLVSFGGSRIAAFNSVLCLWVLGGVMVLLSSFTLDEDEERVQQRSTNATQSEQQNMTAYIV